MDINSTLMLFLTFLGLFVLIKINRLIGRVQRNQLEEQIMREIVRKKVQKRKIDELMGRDNDN